MGLNFEWLANMMGTTLVNGQVLIISEQISSITSGVSILGHIILVVACLQSPTPLVTYIGFDYWVQSTSGVPFEGHEINSLIVVLC